MLFPGDSSKVHMQPVHVRDLAQMAVNLAFHENNGFIDAVGPEKLTFHEFINTECLESLDKFPFSRLLAKPFTTI